MPGVEPAAISSAAVTCTSGRCLSSWFGRSPSTAVNASMQVGTSPGCATQEPSKPSPASRSLSAFTLARACSVTAGSALFGTNAAIPPMACAPRRWQVDTSSSV